MLDLLEFLGNVYCLNFNGVVVLLRIGNIKNGKLNAFEIKLVRYKKGYVRASKNLKESDDPILVPKNINTLRKTTFSIIPLSENIISVDIPFMSPIHKIAMKLNNDYVPVHQVLAERVDFGVCNYCFKTDAYEKEKKEYTEIIGLA